MLLAAGRGDVPGLYVHKRAEKKTTSKKRQCIQKATYKQRRHFFELTLKESD